MHIFEGRYYIYPTTSLPFDQQTFFEVWSSKDMVQWRNEGRIFNLADIPWSGNHAAWAPSVCYRNSLYYFYYSAGDGNGIGVATSTSPAGPFTDALGRPLVKAWPHGARPIDANVFIDDDERAFLYFGHGHAVVVELNDDMVSLKGEFYEVTPEGYVEGPFLYEAQRHLLFSLVGR
jgi:beta-xylosidase